MQNSAFDGLNGGGKLEKKWQDQSVQFHADLPGFSFKFIANLNTS